MSNATPKVENSMYVAREKIYPREIDGRFQRLRHVAVWVLLGIYYLLPWVRWDERQAVLFDLPARQFYIFDLVFWPQDFFYMSWLLIMAALSLFFFTAIAGRLWCGYACPQTVWTEAFLWMERITEGPRQKRMKLDKGPWTREKVLKKTAKQTLWIGFALWTGFTFVGYFTPILELGGKVLGLSLGGWETFWILFYGFATYGNAGFMREQVCLYMCPYARFQSAMFDRNTLVISYDEERGEPRGGRKRGVDPQSVGLGDCIDCNMCVQVCPTGIDIRKGLQYECIACAACVDACDSVMDKMSYPRGLIRYSTQNAMDGKPSRVFRPRTIVYGTLLALLMTGFVYSLATRTPVDFDVIRDRNALYREIPGGTIENVYTLKVVNKDEVAHVYTVTAAGISGISVETDPSVIRVEAGEVKPVAARVLAEEDDAEPGGNDITLTLTADDDPSVTKTIETRYFMPTGRP